MGKGVSLGIPKGAGGGGAVREGVDAVVVVVVVVTVSFRFPRPYAAAVVAAPIAADVPAMRARVNLDMFDIHLTTSAAEVRQMATTYARGRFCRLDDITCCGHLLEEIEFSA